MLIRVLISANGAEEEQRLESHAQVVKAAAEDPAALLSGARTVGSGSPFGAAADLSETPHAMHTRSPGALFAPQPGQTLEF